MEGASQPPAQLPAANPMEHSLKAMEKALSAEDAVMEPGILKKIGLYVRAGGNPATAIEMLSDGYKGTQKILDDASFFLSSFYL